MAKGNHYVSRTWNKEDTVRYIFKVNNTECEAGYYVHYLDELVVENVIELSTSYGCPYKCRYCASSGIHDSRILLSDEMLEVLAYICADNSLTCDDEFTLALTGTGDYSVTYKETDRFLLEVLKKYPHNRAILSSCAWNRNLLERVCSLVNEGVQLLYLQMTFISLDRDRVLSVIPNHPGLENNARELIHEYSKADNSLCGLFRINYLMIRDINSSFIDAQAFLDFFEDEKENVLIRISKLNETSCSCKNRLFAPDIQSLDEMNEMCHRRGFQSYIFMSQKNDNMNCGQLLSDSCIS